MSDIQKVKELREHEKKTDTKIKPISKYKNLLTSKLL